MVRDKQKIRAEWRRALVALLLATGLWFVVSSSESTSTWVPVSISLTLEDDVHLAEPLPRVEVLLTGKRRELFKHFSSAPALQRAITASTGDSARLELRIQDVTLHGGSEAVIRDIRPRLLVIPLKHSGKEP